MATIRNSFIILLFSIFSIGFAANNPPYSNVIFFGDSLSDIGNNAVSTNSNPDGSQPIWTNDFTEALFPGKPLYASLHLPEAPDDNTYNIDFAYGGSITGGDPGPNAPPTLEQQEKLYLDHVKNAPNPNSLFLIWGGGNDMLPLIPSLPPTQHNSPHLALALHDALKENPEFILKNSALPPVKNYVNHLANLIIDLKHHGVPANHIYLLNLPDFANIPIIHGSAKAPAVTALTKKFDDELQTIVSQYIPASHIISIWDFTDKINANPAKYGITNLHKSCMGDEKRPACTGYVYWDAIHPTIHTHQLIADYVSTIIKQQEPKTN